MDHERLDKDVLYEIFKKCSLRETIRMGGVCKLWLSVSRCSRRSRGPQLPWLMMLSNPKSKAGEKEDDARCFFSLSENVIYDPIKFPEICGKRICGSFNNDDACGWLMTIDDNLDMQLFHPWDRIQFQLPNSSTLQGRCPYTHPQCPLVMFLKIRTAAMSDDASEVAVIHDVDALGFWRKGDKVWTNVRSPDVGLGSKKFYVDVLYHRGEFYVLTRDGRVGVLHINTPIPHVEPITEPIEFSAFSRRYLVGDSVSGSLFIFERNTHHLFTLLMDPYDVVRTLGFQVYELGFDETVEYRKNPVKVESLSDRVVFLGQNSSMLVMASQFPGFKGNCIYFTDDLMEFNGFTSPIGCVDMGVFDMEDKTIQPLFLNRAHPTFSPPIWISPPVMKLQISIFHHWRKNLKAYSMFPN